MKEKSKLRGRNIFIDHDRRKGGKRGAEKTERESRKREGRRQKS